MANRFCEDILDQILSHLLQIEGDGIWAEEHIPTSFILGYMLVGRTWLEVGRRRLYSAPNLTKSSDCMPFFQASLLHINAHLGTYVRTFDAIGIGLGPAGLSRMVALMSDLRVLVVESLDFIDYYPKDQPIPCLSILEVSCPDDDNRRISTVIRRKFDKELLLDSTKLHWICTAQEVRLRCFAILARTAISLPASSSLHTLSLDRCIWHHSTYAEAIPQLSSRLRSLHVENFGRCHREVSSSGWRNDDTWEDPDAPSYRDVTSFAVESQLPSLYMLARNAQFLELKFARKTAFSVVPDLSLLSGSITVCEVDYQDSVIKDPHNHRYPPNTRGLRVRVDKLDTNLFRFVHKLQNPNQLGNLETLPEIWIKATSKYYPLGENPSITLEVRNPEEWEAARQSALAAWASRGLEPTGLNTDVKAMQMHNHWHTPGVERRSWTTSRLEYRSFWSWPFSASTETTNPNTVGNAMDDIW